MDDDEMWFLLLSITTFVSRQIKLKIALEHSNMYNGAAMVATGIKEKIKYGPGSPVSEIHVSDVRLIRCIAQWFRKRILEL